jgi:hypothetical protein
MKPEVKLEVHLPELAALVRRLDEGFDQIIRAAYLRGLETGLVWGFLLGVAVTLLLLWRHTRG